MMPTFPWRRTVPPACALMIASCAGYPPPSVPVPPRLTLPAAATTPCALDRLPEYPTQADLEAAYMARGGHLLACDAARQLAVDTLRAERALQDRWRAGTGPRP